MKTKPRIILEQDSNGRKRIIFEQPNSPFDDLRDELSGPVSRFFYGVKSTLGNAVASSIVFYSIVLVGLYWLLFHHPMCQVR